MRDVLKATDMSLIREAWQRVFSTNNAFVYPFKRFRACRIFYPTDGYHLTEDQFSSIMTASRGAGEIDFLISIVESEGTSFLDRSWGHWACSAPSYKEYSELPLALENALYSTRGRWGILVSHEMHALVGGTAPFLTRLDELYLSWANDLRRLREDWVGNPNASWVEPIVARSIKQE